MPTITTADGTEIFYKDWGTGQPIVFHHGWPLVGRRLGRADDVLPAARLSRHRPRPARPRPIHPDRRRPRHGPLRRRCRRGGRRTSISSDAIHVGHSTGGGEVARYVARHGEGRVAKAVLISAVPPLMLKTDANPGGLPNRGVRRLPDEVADQPRQVLPRPARGPFYGYNRPGAKPSEAIIEQLVAAGHDGRRARPTTTASWRSRRPTSPKT